MIFHIHKALDSSHLAYVPLEEQKAELNEVL